VKQPFVFLTLPGWLNSEPTHWQSLWEMDFGDQRVQQADWDHPLRGDWQIALQEHVLALLDTAQLSKQSEPKLVLIAHSLGVHLVSAWAEHSQLVRHIHAAFLVAPPDLTRRADIPPPLRSWSPPVLRALPFLSYLVCSDDDPYASLQASRTMSQAWGCKRCIEIKAGGHLNAASGLGAWNQGRQWLTELIHLPIYTQGVV
jgi:uncharacterized protein